MGISTGRFLRASGATGMIFMETLWIEIIPMPSPWFLARIAVFTGNAVVN
jgi:hypothetical protein